MALKTLDMPIIPSNTMALFSHLHWASAIISKSLEGLLLIFQPKTEGFSVSDKTTKWYDNFIACIYHGGISEQK